MIPRPLKVGVTLFIRDGRQSWWENGIHQNALFLLMLLARSPVVAHCFVVNGGPGTAGIGAQFDCPVIDPAQAMDTLDLVIELGAQLKEDWAADFRARGGRIIAMRVANDFVIDMECIAHNRPPGQLVFGVTYDQVWTLPAFAATCAPYYAHLLRAPVRIMPHLWSPVLIERGGDGWGYRPAGVPMPVCQHLAHSHYVAPKVHVCAECVAMGDEWVHLRTCLECGHVGCCDSSKNRHATKHFQMAAHPVIASAQPGERWLWCYVHQEWKE